MNLLCQTVPLQYDTVYSPYAAAEWKAAFADLHAQGFTGVEIAVAYPERIDADAVNREAEKRALTVTSISTGQAFGRDGWFLASRDAKIRACAADVLRAHIALSANIGRPRVTIGLLRGRPEQPTAESLRLLGETLPPLIELAERAGVTLQIEPINRAETTFLNTTRETLHFLRSLGNPGSVGLLYDTFHSHLEDGDMLAAAREAGERMTNVHIAGVDRCLPGEGAIDFPAVLAEILKTGYAGPIALETMCVPSREFVLANAGAALLDAVRAAKERL